MSIFFYNIFLILYAAGVRLASLWNPKAEKWVKGRKNLFDLVKEQLKDQHENIWVHCSSVGEFEQAKPLIERFLPSHMLRQAGKAKDEKQKIILTFFSPSGYEANKDYPNADFIFYLPLDSAGNAKKFINVINPSLVIWVKYDFWYYYLKELNRRKIPCILISAVFRKQQSFFQWYGGLQKKMLFFFTQIFVQDEKSKRLLKTIGIENCEVSGDTRFDRVIQIAENFQPIPLIEDFIQHSKCIVAGSTWREDELALKQVYELTKTKDIRLIIAPHEIHEKRIDELMNIFPDALKLSQIETERDKGKILIIDNMGMLSRLYKYGYINYVGGGFTRDGIHNILEAAVYGKPVLFGPNYEKYREATELIAAGGARSFSRGNDLGLLVMLLLQDPIRHAQQSEASKNYVWKNKGATKKILHYIQEKRLLTS